MFSHQTLGTHLAGSLLFWPTVAIFDKWKLLVVYLKFKFVCQPSLATFQYISGFVFAVCHSLVLWSAGLGELCTSPKGVGLSGETLGRGPLPADTARSLGWPGKRQILARCWQVKKSWTTVPLMVLSHKGPVLGPGFITLTLGQCLYNSLELQFILFTSLKRKQWKYQEPAFA